MSLPSFVLAYHGCDEDVAERILQGKDHVQASINDYDWLGTGAYFWEDNPSRALSWVKFLKKHPQYARTVIKKPAVIGAIIVPGRCLNLTEADSLSILSKAHEQFVSMIQSVGTTLPKNTLPQNKPGYMGDTDLVQRYLDCAVINFLHKMRQEENLPPFETLRGAFFEGGPLYPGAGIAEKTHIQWCVPNPRRNIRGYFRVLPEWDKQQSKMKHPPK